VVSVEQEEERVEDCTCGLGPVGNFTDHGSRGCQGIGLMGRLDFICRHRQTMEYSYHEFKTMAWPTDAESWETRLQFLIGYLAAERRLEQPMSAHWIHGLLKGRREGRDYDPVTKGRTGPKIQASGLCQPYCHPGQPPLSKDEWAPSHSFIGEDGKNHKLPKGFARRGVWEADWDLGDCASQAEYWVKWLTEAERKQHLSLIGPMNRQDSVVEPFLRQLVANEKEWRDKVWEMYEQCQHLGTFGSEGVQHMLDIRFPCSWACRKYGTHHRCVFEDVCFRRQGWEDPLGSGQFVLRVPHHEPEKQQAVDRGCLLPEDLAEEEEDG
jgi:hypothetical protein